MKGENDKNPSQVVFTKAEYDTVKVVSVYRGFKSVNKYLRSLVEADVVAYKKTAKNPVVGIDWDDWNNLSEQEREQYLNQIAPVKPRSFDYFLKQQSGQAERNKNDLGL